MIEIFFKKKAVITSIFVSSVLILVSTAVPIINGSNISEIEEKNYTEKTTNNNNYLFYGKNVKNLLDNNSTIGDLISLLQNEIKNSNKKSSMILIDKLFKMLTNVYGTDILDLPLKDFFDFMYYFNPTLDEAFFNDFFTKDLITIHKEIMMILNGEKSLNNISNKLKFLLDYINENIKKKQVLPDDDLPLKVNTFNDYYKVYDKINELWHSRGDLEILYKILGYDETNFYDWSSQRDANDEQVYYFTLFVMGLGILVVLVGSDPLVDALGCVALSVVVLYDAVLLVYIINVNEYFDRIQASEPDIILHVVYENEDHEYIGVTGLHGEFIKAINDDSMKVCIEKNNIEAWNMQYFVYSLGPSSYMEDQTGETGWYSLKEREYISDIYENAPCPPGNWTINVGGNNYWKLNSTIYKNIGGREVIIIDPYILEPIK